MVSEGLLTEYSKDTYSSRMEVREVRFEELAPLSMLHRWLGSRLAYGISVTYSLGHWSVNTMMGHRWWSLGIFEKSSRQFIVITDSRLNYKWPLLCRSRVSERVSLSVRSLILNSGIQIELLAGEAST